MQENTLQLPLDEIEIDGEIYVFVKCHGVSIYERDEENKTVQVDGDGTVKRIVAEGVDFDHPVTDNENVAIVGNQLYSPNHQEVFLVKKEDARLIRRCPSCQDLTVRGVRSEGVDFCIPSEKNKGQTKLKSTAPI